jgi:hypothetical protein
MSPSQLIDLAHLREQTAPAHHAHTHAVAGAEPRINPLAALLSWLSAERQIGPRS